MGERIALVALLVAVGCGSEAAAPAAAPPVPAAAAPVAVPPVAAPVAVPPIAPAPVAAEVAPPPVAPTLGIGDPIPFAPTPPAAGPAVEPIEGVEWDTFRLLLAATTPISRGTRSGYRALADSTLDFEAEMWVPELYSGEGTSQRSSPAWWRPAAGTTLLVVPYRLLGGHGGLGLAIFEPGPGGVRYVRHLDEAEETGEGGCWPVVNLVGATSDGTEWRRLVSCEYGGAVVSIRLRDGAIEIREQTLGDHAEPSGTWNVIAPPAPPAPPPVAAAVPDPSAATPTPVATPTPPATPPPPATPVPVIPPGTERLLVAYCSQWSSAPQCTGPLTDSRATRPLITGACWTCAANWGSVDHTGWEPDDMLEDMRGACGRVCRGSI